VGLIPENELSSNAGVAIDPKTNGPVFYENMETSIPGIFACGNVAHVHDLVDFVSEEAKKAGRFAALFAANGTGQTEGTKLPALNVQCGEGVGYVVPQKIRPVNVGKFLEVFFRTTAIYKESKIEIRSGGEVLASFKRDNLSPGEMEKIVVLADVINKAATDITVCVNSATKQAGSNVKFRTTDANGCVELICIVCPQGCHLKVDPSKNYEVSGHTCERGEDYGKQEIGNPTRVITSTVCISGAELPRLPVKTDKPIPKEKISDVMKLLDGLEMKGPVQTGTIIVKDICGTGAHFVATRSL
jgi:CxxC motif-containing protein